MSSWIVKKTGHWEVLWSVYWDLRQHCLQNYIKKLIQPVILHNFNWPTIIFCLGHTGPSPPDFAEIQTAGVGGWWKWSTAFFYVVYFFPIQIVSTHIEYFVKGYTR